MNNLSIICGYLLIRPQVLLYEHSRLLLPEPQGLGDEHVVSVGPPVLEYGLLALLPPHKLHTVQPPLPLHPEERLDLYHRVQSHLVAESL